MIDLGQRPSRSSQKKSLVESLIASIPCISSPLLPKLWQDLARHGINHKDLRFQLAMAHINCGFKLGIYFMRSHDDLVFLGSIEVTTASPTIAFPILVGTRVHGIGLGKLLYFAGATICHDRLGAILRQSEDSSELDQSFWSRMRIKGLAEYDTYGTLAQGMLNGTPYSHPLASFKANLAKELIKEGILTVILNQMTTNQKYPEATYGTASSDIPLWCYQGTSLDLLLGTSESQE